MKRHGLKQAWTRCAVPTALWLGLFAGPAGAQAPMVREGTTAKVTEGVYVIPDGRVNLVPNVGIIIGERGILVIDTGMGPENARRVLNEVRKLSPKPIRFLTVTHFHPEHGMGAQAFPPETVIIYPKAQKEELLEKRQPYLQMFSGFSPEIAALLKDVRLVSPDVVFEHEAEIDLGDMPVRLLHFGAAHTRGDNFVFLPKQGILFAGDVVVNRFFPILPDTDANGSNWIRILDQLEKLGPATIVPGHGAVGDAKLIGTMREYLVSLRARVTELHHQGQPLEKIEATLTPEIRAKYKDWDNPNWIKNAIENFHAELTHK
jgi:glyoxylase-like metal-dependent hydrolase (beta-lactamase superfamily II)